MSATTGKPRGRPPFWRDAITEQHPQRTQSWHLNGGGSQLVRAPWEPGDEQEGGWSRAQLMEMDDRFRARLMHAFERQTEREASAANRIAAPLW